jgi:hypothetical protein
LTETVNGYANRETFDVVLYLGNDQDWQRVTSAIALRAYADAWDDGAGEPCALTGDDLERYAVRVAGDALSEWWEGRRGAVIDGTMDRDSRAAIVDAGSSWRVDWSAVALSLLPEHAGYPHEWGRLYDCAGCESSCHCVPGQAECVYGGTHNGRAAC